MIGKEMASTQKTFAPILGIILLVVSFVLLLLGIFGFVNNSLVGDSSSLSTNTLQNVFYVVASICGIYAGSKLVGR